ncbi:MAG: three component ABC system middle component [Proteocatella sp.]
MIDKYINKLNTNPFWGGLIIQAFHRGYDNKECPLILHYIILPMVLYGDIRKSLLHINKNTTLTNFVSQNRANLIDLQQLIWKLKYTTNQALTGLHNKEYIQLKEHVRVIKTIDYNNYDDDMKKYLRAATYLGVILKKETLLDAFKILKIIP